MPPRRRERESRRKIDWPLRPTSWCAHCPLSQRTFERFYLQERSTLPTKYNRRTSNKTCFNSQHVSSQNLIIPFAHHIDYGGTDVGTMARCTMSVTSQFSRRRCCPYDAQYTTYWRLLLKYEARKLRSCCYCTHSWFETGNIYRSYISEEHAAKWLNMGFHVPVTMSHRIWDPWIHAWKCMRAINWVEAKD